MFAASEMDKELILKISEKFLRNRKKQELQGKIGQKIWAGGSQERKPQRLRSQWKEVQTQRQTEKCKLKQQGDSTYTYQVGKNNNIESRIMQHIGGDAGIQKTSCRAGGNV